MRVCKRLIAAFDDVPGRSGRATAGAGLWVGPDAEGP